MTDILERRQARYNAPQPGIDCPARWHRTASATRRHRCVCPDAVQAYETEKAHKRVPGGPGKGVDAARMAELARLAVLRFAPPRTKIAAGYDPRDTWRGPQCRVDALTLDFLTAGYRFAGIPPTRREFQLAVWRLSDAGWTIGRIAAALDIDGRAVDRHLAYRRITRAERTRRRHADAVWRAWHKHGQRW